MKPEPLAQSVCSEAPPLARTFGRNRRLASARDYRRVFRSSQRSSDRLFTVLAARAPAGATRLGLAIAKKHLKLAVSRNKTKRIVRESFRHHQTLLAGLDLVVIARAGLRGSLASEQRKSLERHWARVRARCDAS